MNIKQDYIQYNVNKVALYSLPSNLKLDSIDFEQCILECIRNKLDERKQEKNGLSKRMINEIQIHSDLMLLMEQQQQQQSSSALQDNNIQNANSNLQSEDFRYTVAIHKNKLLWTVLPPPKHDNEESIEIDLKQSNCYLQTSFNDIKLCYVNYQMPTLIIWLILSIPKKVFKNVHELSVISKYCDPNTNNTTTTTTTSTNKASIQQSSQQQKVTHLKNDSLFALVWKCFTEQDVVQLREVYKYLQSLRRLNQVDFLQNDSLSSMITFNRLNSTTAQKCVRTDNEINNSNITDQPQQHRMMHHKMIDINDVGQQLSSTSNRSSTNSSSSSSSTTTTIGSTSKQTDELMLTRQRQPAKIIHEETNTTTTTSPSIKLTSSSAINLKSYLETMFQHNKTSESATNNINNSKKAKDKEKSTFITEPMYKYFNTKSEFDTTQIKLYLKNNKRFQRKSSMAQAQMSRSRSVDSSRHYHSLYEFSPKDVHFNDYHHQHHHLAHQHHHQTNFVKTVPVLKCKTEKPGGGGSNNNHSFIRSFVDLLNSEGSSVSDESSSGEYNDGFIGDEFGGYNKNPIVETSKPSNESILKNKQPIVVKSVLKKTSSSLNNEESQQQWQLSSRNVQNQNSQASVNHSSSSSSSTSSSSSLTTGGTSSSPFSSLSATILGDRFRFGNHSKKQQHHNNNNGNISNCNKKNVTFSAYATIQVVDT